MYVISYAKGDFLTCLFTPALVNIDVYITQLQTLLLSTRNYILYLLQMHR